MNAIFLKEVPDTVLKGKLVCLKQISISKEDYIIEISLANKVVQNINRKMKGISWINAIRIKHVANRFNKKIASLIKKNNLTGYSVIYTNEIRKKTNLKEYLDDLLKKYSILEYINVSSVEKNTHKYIEEYTKKNDLKPESINVLVILNDLEKLNIKLLENLNERYKEVNVLTTLKPTKKFLNNIKNINDEYGSCISILSKPEKDLKKYNIYVFVDRPRTEYTKYKFNRKACFIDFTNKENDKFNEKYIKLEKGIKNNIYYADKIKELYSSYGKITISNVIID